MMLANVLFKIQNVTAECLSCIRALPIVLFTLKKQQCLNAPGLSGRNEEHGTRVFTYNPINTAFYHGDILRHSKGVYSVWLAIQSLHLTQSPKQRRQCSLPPGEKTPLPTASNNLESSHQWQQILGTRSRVWDFNTSLKFS